MGTIYLRRGIYYVGFRDAAGRWRYKSTGFRQGQEAKVRKLLHALEEAVRRGDRIESLSATTFHGYGKAWSVARTASGLHDAAREWQRVLKHVVPQLGPMKLSEIRPRHIREMVDGLRKGLAPRSVANIYGAVHRLFEDAVAEELIDVTPCVLAKSIRPRRIDKNPAWRATAIYSRTEAELLVTSKALSEHSRVLYAIGFLTGMRQGEIAALRWDAYHPEEDLLGRLSVHASYTRHNGVEKGTKTEVPRQVPVHPHLAKVLAAWKLAGWAKTYGRAPKPEDLVVPNQWGRYLTETAVRKAMKRDFALLGITRWRRFHDARRTFITLGLTDGASEWALKWITHTPPKGAFDLYKTPPWSALCEAVLALRLRARPRSGRLTAITGGGRR